jgi:ribosomal protein S18 acetylase RimI-like enzyme
MLVLSRQDLLQQTSNHPYVGLMTSGPEMAVYGRGDAYVWLAQGPWGPVTASLGSASEVLPLLAELQAAGTDAWTAWTHLPRASAAAISEHVTATVQDDWDFLWTLGVPPFTRHEDRIELLTDVDSAGINAVLDDAMPDSTTRPGDPRVRAWYGIRDGGRLVAVAADRSRGATGFLAGIAVAGGHQGQGLGAALTAAITRLLLHEYASVALGVMVDNAVALRLYERLGYRHRIERTSVKLGS